MRRLLLWAGVMATAIACAGNRPYEFTDANRTTDDYPPLVDFEQEATWRVCVRGGAVAGFARAQDEQLFGDWTGRLNYHAEPGSDKPIVEIRATRVFPVPSEFDTCTCWIRGTKFGRGANRDPETPSPSMSINFILADGSRLSLPFTKVDWMGWQLVNKRFSSEEITRLKGATFLGFSVSGGTQSTDRVIHFDNFAIFKEKLEALSLLPRAKRNLRPLALANQGLNTGDGTLDFPTREETILPEGARDMPKEGEPLPQFNGGALKEAEQAAAKVSEHRIGRTLVVDVTAEAGEATTIWTGYPTEGEVVGAIEVPFLNIGSGNRRIRVDMLRIAGQTNTWFRLAMFDWYRSNASKLAGIPSRVKNAGPSMLADYQPLTDGSYNAVSERIFITLSPRFEDVLPTIANPKSQWKHVAGRKVWRSHASFDREQDKKLWQAIHDHGMREILITDHETMWRTGGESFTLRTKTDPLKGGDEAEKEYSRFLRHELGFSYGPYNNYVEFAPVNEHWSRDLASRRGDGSFVPAWMRCHGLKPAAAPALCEKVAPILKEKFDFDTAYCDVHTAVAPWQLVDFDARVPGAGTFSETYYAYGEVLELQKRAWNGPVWSEGSVHFLYAGLVDGNYGQDSGYRCETKPWLVDFDLRKIHPLEVDFGMGSLSMFAPGRSDLEKTYYLPNAPTKEALTNLVDRFIGCTLAFGHSGYLIADYLYNPPKAFGAAYGKPGAQLTLTDEGFSIAMKSYFMVQQIAARYTQTDVDEIRYVDGDGHLLTTSEALTADAVRRNQVLVRYKDGTIVLVNGNESERLVADVDGVRHDLPPRGYHAWTANRDVVVASDDQGGARADYCESPDYIYIDGRGRDVERPRARAKGTAVCRTLTNGWEVISLGGETCSFNLDGEWKVVTFKSGEYRTFLPGKPRATVREEPIVLPTYGFSDPDPVPSTEEKRYPYFRYDGTTNQRELRTWRSVVLENRRVKVTMLPEIGGKVWGAVDKQTGREFLYFNHTVKFRNIAMRGPWCSGGIEFNFGIMGHSPTTATPVDWCIMTNRDESVSCFVSATEYINRTTWQVEVRLPPDSDHFYTRTTWFNGSNLHQPYYQWMTAAYSARGNPKLYFPGSAYIGHDGDWHTWNIDGKGRDLSRYANNAFGHSKSYHVINGDNRMFAVWWPDAGFGSIHQNAVYDKYGRKIWLWALSREGGIWEDLLTDTDGQYVELQSGRIFNQARGTTYLTPFKHPTFAPGATDTFDERWGVVRDESKLIAKCNPTNYVTRPLEMPKDFDWKSMYGHYLRGEQAIRERDDKVGEAELRECLKMEPNYAPALTVLAGLQARRGRYAEVRELCARALSMNTYDAAANYYDGLAALAQDDLETAKERLGLAAFSPEYRASAYVLIAKARMRGAHWDEARAAADRCLLANPSSPDALLVRIACLRKTGHVRQAEASAKLVLTQWPLFHGAKFELQLLGKAAGFKDSLRNELPHQTFLELGSWYEEAGLYEEALELFGYAANKPIARIRAAAANNFLGRRDAALADLEAASRLQAGFAYPFRRESRAALLWAMGQHESWKFRYWAAVFLAANGEVEKARSMLSVIQNADEDVFYLYRASLEKGVARMKDLYTAKSLNPSWRVYRDLAAHWLEENDAEHMLRETTEGIARHPQSNPLQMAHARALVNTRRFNEAVEYLETIHVLPSEHKDNAHAIWVDAWKGIEAEANERGDNATAELARARAAEYPENLGAGKPFSDED